MCDRIAHLQRLTRTFFQVTCLIACTPAHAEEIVKSLLQTVSDADAADETRLTAARDVVSFRVNDPHVAKQIVEQLEDHGVHTEEFVLGPALD